MPYTDDQISKLSPEELQAEIARVEAQMAGQQRSPMSRMHGALTGGLRGFAGKPPEAAGATTETQAVYAYDEETGEMKKIGDTEKGAKVITKKAPKVKEEKPFDVPKGEIAGAGTAPGWKTGAIVEGEKVPIKPFVEKPEEEEPSITQSRRKTIGQLHLLMDKNAPMEDIEDYLRYEGYALEDFAEELEEYQPEPVKRKRFGIF